MRSIIRSCLRKILCPESSCALLPSGRSDSCFLCFDQRRSLQWEASRSLRWEASRSLQWEASRSLEWEAIRGLHGEAFRSFFGEASRRRAFRRKFRSFLSKLPDIPPRMRWYSKDNKIGPRKGEGSEKKGEGVLNKGEESAEEKGEGHQNKEESPTRGGGSLDKGKEGLGERWEKAGGELSQTSRQSSPQRPRRDEARIVVPRRSKKSQRPTSTDSWATNEAFDINTVSIHFYRGLPVLVIPLPSRREKCMFIMRPISNCLADLALMLKAEDTGIDRVTAYDHETGIRICGSTTIESLLDRDFDLVINNRRSVNEPVKLSKKADRSTTVWTWLCLGYLALQYGIVARLTWWEYSWDIMEPITYFITFTTACIGYAYFVLTRQNFDYTDWADRHYLQRFHRAAKKEAFDINKYNELRTAMFEVQNELRRLRDPLQMHLPPGQLQSMLPQNFPDEVLSETQKRLLSQWKVNAINKPILPGRSLNKRERSYETGTDTHSDSFKEIEKAKKVPKKS
ncbi:unnamed protein product [Cyprideis torosa]|uniref:Uncharacterized protein n=1 Tax=Cyprideis torosa TaxID=163714 RepID=A0A7R8WSK5_9CRUS|nr:unnamed protein product [Cyprideis torosa]CAG0904898.1 unnamed protein product [Cyprideis torosa]